MQPLLLLRRLGALLFLLALLAVAGCGGHGGHESARAKAARLMRRGLVSGQFSEDARATGFTTFNLYLSSGAGVAAFNTVSATSSYAHIYRADVSDVRWNASPTDDSVGTLTLRLTNFSAESPFAGDASFSGSYKLDATGLRLTGGSITGKLGGGTAYTVKLEPSTVGDPSKAEVADPHYAGTIEPPKAKTSLSWDGSIARIDDAHVRIRIASSLGDIECDAVDTKGVLMGEFNGGQIDYAGTKGQIFLTQLDGVVYGVYHLYDPRGSIVGSGNIFAQKGVQATSVTAGYYVGTMTRGAGSSGNSGTGDEPKASARPFGLKIQIGVGDSGAALFTPTTGTLSYAGHASASGGTLAVSDLTGYYRSISFVKTNRSTLEMSGTYRATLASDASIEVGTFKVASQAAPAQTYYPSANLKGDLKSATGGAATTLASKFAPSTDDPLRLTVTPESGPALAGYYVGDEFAASTTDLRLSGKLSGVATTNATGVYERIASGTGIVTDRGTFFLQPYTPTDGGSTGGGTTGGDSTGGGTTGGSTGAFSTGLYAGTLTTTGSAYARPLRLDVLTSTATEGKNGAAILASPTDLEAAVGGRVVSVSGDNASVTVTVKAFTALYDRAYFNGKVAGGVFSGTYSLIGKAAADTEDGTFTATLNPNPTRRYLQGLWNATFQAGSPSASVLRIIQFDSEVAFTPATPVTLDGATVPLASGYTAGEFFVGRAVSDDGTSFVGDFFATTNAAANHFDGFIHARVGGSVRSSGFSGEK